MLQIVFNEISAAEMAALPKEMQLDLLDEFHFLPEEIDASDETKFGVVERDGKKLFRYRLAAQSIQRDQDCLLGTKVGFKLLRPYERPRIFSQFV